MQMCLTAVQLDYTTVVKLILILKTSKCLLNTRNYIVNLAGSLSLASLASYRRPTMSCTPWSMDIYLVHRRSSLREEHRVSPVV